MTIISDLLRAGGIHCSVDISIEQTHHYARPFAGVVDEDKIYIIIHYPVMPNEITITLPSGGSFRINGFEKLAWARTVTPVNDHCVVFGETLQIGFDIGKAIEENQNHAREIFDVYLRRPIENFDKAKRLQSIAKARARIADSIREPLMSAIEVRRRTISELERRVEEALNNVQRFNEDLRVQYDAMEALTARVSLVHQANDLWENLFGLAPNFIKEESIHFTFDGGHIKRISVETQPCVVSIGNVPVNFGTFIITAEIANEGVKINITEGTGNQKFRGHIHPHVASDGAICSGNMGEALRNASRSYNFPECIRIICMLLNSYNDGSPYVRVESGTWLSAVDRSEEFEKCIKTADPQYDCLGCPLTACRLHARKFERCWANIERIQDYAACINCKKCEKWNTANERRQQSAEE